MCNAAQEPALFQYGLAGNAIINDGGVNAVPIALPIEGYSEIQMKKSGDTKYSEREQGLSRISDLFQHRKNILAC